jgi:predicted ATPase
VAGLAGLSWALLVLGYPEQALARSREGLTYARELAHRNTVGYALLYGCILCQLCRQWQDARERADALTSLATEEGFPHFLGAATIVRASAATEERLTEAEVEQLQQGLATWRATGAEFLVPYFLALLAKAHAKAGRSAAALDLLTEALARVEETKERWHEAELHRLRGELLLMLPTPDHAEAEASLRRALAVAVEREAKLWELRAAMSLARLWCDQGRRAEAHDLLAPVYGCFAEGFDTPDLIEANALLGELA